MNSGTPVISMLWCLTNLLLIHPSLTEKEGLYLSILQEYHEIVSNLADGFMYAGRPLGKCKNACKGEAKKSDRAKENCRCDQKCVVFGDCCLDYWRSCNSSFTEAYDRQQMFKCLVPRLTLAKSNKTKVVKMGYQVVVRCPSFYKNPKVKKSCENPARSLLFVEGSDGRTYRNHHCAECHGVVGLERWNTKLHCNKGTPDDIRTKLTAHNFTFNMDERRRIREHCHIEMQQVNGSTPTKCARAQKCGNKTSPDYKKCHAYKRLIYPRFMLPKDFPIWNPHCARCEKMNLRILVMTSMHGGSPREESPSLAILFDFTKASVIYGLRKTKQVHVKCGVGEVYDFKRMECRLQRVSSDVVLKNWTCELLNETFPNTSDHVIVFKNRSIFVFAHDKMYAPQRYHLHGANVTVCGNFATRFLKTVKGQAVLYSHAEFYITLVGFSLSILALLAVIITYSLFSELRTLPGKIVINLAVALLLSQLAFLFDMVKDVSVDACFGIAIVLHYLFLASFCWMNVMAVDVSRTFAGKSHRSPSSSRGKVFLFCLLYAWGLPLVIVGITLTVNQYGGLHVGYGNDYYCWITNPIALVVFFAAPVVAMLLFNIVALVRVLVAVRRVRKITKKVRDKSTGQDIRMCWKLTAVFGLTWIIGIAAGYHIVIRIVYIVCNSFQGVFIMIAFILTRRVVNMYLRKAGKEPIRPRSSSTQKSMLTNNTTVSSNRIASAGRLVECKPITKRQEQPEEAEEVALYGDSAEDQLIASLEGPETKL